MPMYAQFERAATTIRGAAMGGSSVALTDVASSMHNIAGMANHSGVNISLAYIPNYLFESMGDKWLSAAYQLTKTGTALLSYHHFGNKHYSEQSLSLGYAQALSSSVALGATLDYLYSGVVDGYYQSLQGLTFSLAFQMQIGQHCVLGSRLFNPALVRLSDDNDRLPASINVGVAYQFSPEWTTTVEIEKTIYSPVSLHAGAEYLFLKRFAARIGFATEPLLFCFGVGVQYEHYQFDVAATVHQLLGITPMLGGSVHF